MKCALCEEQFANDDLEEMKEMGKAFYHESNYFICPDCYDDYRRMCLEDQLSIVMESVS